MESRAGLSWEMFQLKPHREKSEKKIKLIKMAFGEKILY